MNRQGDPAYERERKKAWRAAHPETAHAAQQRAHARARGRFRPPPPYGWQLGLKRGEFAAMHEAQMGVCAICGLPETLPSKVRKGPSASSPPTGEVQRLSIDHDHTTGIIRGLLCHRCNAGLGLFKDDSDRLQRAIQYLARAGHRRDTGSGSLVEWAGHGRDTTRAGHYIHKQGVPPKKSIQPPYEPGRRAPASLSSYLQGRYEGAVRPFTPRTKVPLDK
jgi:hypothetical protein